MGFFKSLLKKTKPEPAGYDFLEDFPDLYNGMKVEVLTPANALIFVGKLRILGNDLLEIRGESGGYLPRGLYNQPVKLRAFPREGDPFTLDGKVGANGHDFWRIEKLRYLQSSENHTFFRQMADTEGWVHPITFAKGQRFPCTVLDVSAGGARVLTEKLFELNSAFQLETAFLPGETPFTITCLVKRIQVRTKPGSPTKKFEYGCQFSDMSPREQDRLLQSIFTLQRKALRSRRDQ